MILYKFFKRFNLKSIKQIVQMVLVVTRFRGGISTRRKCKFLLDS